MTSKLTVVISALMLLGTPVLAQAQGSPPAAATKETAAPAAKPSADKGKASGEKGKRFAACQQDVATHCKNIERGRGNRLRCLKENEAKLSPECKALVTAVPAKK